MPTMTEPPATEGPQRSTLIAVGIGGVVGIVVVLWAVGLSPGEIAATLLPIAVGTAVALLALLWAKRRGDL